MQDSDLRRRHDMKAAINSLKTLAEIFEAGIELSDEEKRDIAAKLREGHALLTKEFAGFFSGESGKK